VLAFFKKLPPCLSASRARRVKRAGLRLWARSRID
jgi:hypothetical protein